MIEDPMAEEIGTAIPPFRLEKMLDDALDQTFPASDPVGTPRVN